jgi:hypothetical protein
MNMDLANHGKGKAVYMAGQKLWEKLPEFTYQAPNLGWVLSRQTLSMWMLGIWCVLAGGAAWVTSKNLRVI